jgi:hypothetical protein
LSRQHPKKILFSPASGNPGDDDLPIDMGENGSSAGSPNTKDVLKVYMKNQLDLQESEWETYEETFNAIAEKLEDVEDQLANMTEERDALLNEKNDWIILKNDYEVVSQNLEEVKQVRR